jgi:hypothetical protein
LTVPTFTPKKFVTLLLAAILVTLATTNRTPAPHHSVPSGQFGLYPATQAVGQDNGTLTNNYYLATSYTPTPVTHSPDRHTVSTEPQMPTSPQPSPIRHNYPPMAR